MAINCLTQFLKSERDLDREYQAEYERQQKEKDRILRRIMNTNLRFAGMAFRQALEHTVAERERQIALAKKQRGVMMRMLDSNTRLMGMGFNKLIEESKARKESLRNKLKYVIKTLTDKDAASLLMAYNEMKQRYQMLQGVGMGDAVMKKIS